VSDNSARAGDAVSDAVRPGDGATPEAPPPLLSRWRNLYALLLVELCALVALFYALTRWAS
jgi:hypothetical protein